MQWYYMDEEERIGPFSEEDFELLVTGGTIKPETMVWNDNLPKWLPYGEIQPNRDTPQQAAPPPPSMQNDTPKVRCAGCGKNFAPEDLIRIGNADVCANCKPFFVQSLKQGVNVQGAFEYGGFWIRGGALFIDGIITTILNMVVSMILLLLFSQGSLYLALSTIISLAIGIGYFIWFNGRYGATPGKMALGLKIIRSDGSDIGYGRATGRYFGYMLSGLILGIGLLMAAFDDEKRSLHDRLCDTRVIKVRK